MSDNRPIQTTVRGQHLQCYLQPELHSCLKAVTRSKLKIHDFVVSALKVEVDVDAN